MPRFFGMLPLLITLVGMTLQGCAVFPQGGSSKKGEIILATTTSTYDSGLLDELIPVFEAQSGYVVKIISVGTGKALRMGEEGNADLLLVHAPQAEEEFMQQGFGSERYLVMHNDFVILGPPDDPAGVRGWNDPVRALAQIATSQAIFASRGDDSGTHKKERAYWEDAGVDPTWNGYLETGQGMGATLQVASEKGAYVLSDRATYLSLKNVLNLDVLVEGHPSLLNIYHVILINPERWPQVNQAGARELARFLLSPAGQKIIETFGIEKYGQPLFYPDAGKTEADLGL